MGGHTIAERLRSFVAARADDPLVRITVPYLWAHQRAGIRTAPLSGGGTAAVSGLRLFEAAKARTGLRSPFLVSGDVIASVSTRNQARSLDRVWRGLGQAPQSARARPSWGSLRRSGARAIGLTDELVGSIGDNHPDFVADRTEIAHGFLFGAAMYSLATAQLAARRPRVALITSSHGLAARALALLAREAGISSVYVPHAPLIASAELADLPVDYAAVRGSAEVDRYKRSGADPNRLVAAGDPSIEPPQAPPALDSSLPCIFAPSPISPSLVRSLIDRIAKATPAPIVVSPHPRQRPSELRRASPGHWTIAEGRTYDRLVAGHPVLLQHSSGVALEGLQLGIPTIELTLPDRPTLYPFIAEPYVPHAGDVAQLAGAIKEAQASALDPEKRARLRGWSQRWVAETGDLAAERICELILRAKEEGPKATAIWDAWVPEAPGQQPSRASA